MSQPLKTYILVLDTAPHVVSIRGDSLSVESRPGGERWWVVKEGSDNIAEIKEETVVGWVKEMPENLKQQDNFGQRSMWPMFHPLRVIHNLNINDDGEEGEENG